MQSKQKNAKSYLKFLFFEEALQFSFYAHKFLTYQARQQTRPSNAKTHQKNKPFYLLNLNFFFFSWDKHMYTSPRIKQLFWIDWVQHPKEAVWRNEKHVERHTTKTTHGLVVEKNKSCLLKKAVFSHHRPKNLSYFFPMNGKYIKVYIYIRSKSNPIRKNKNTQLLLHPSASLQQTTFQ